MNREVIVKIDSTGSTFEYGQEIVHCGECEHYGTSSCAMTFVNNGLIYVWNRDDDFCSWGKKNAS